MIAVLPLEADRESVGEFFELFKTAWSFDQDGRPHDVVLIAVEAAAEAELNAKLVIVYGSAALDDAEESDSSLLQGGTCLCCPLGRIPIYGQCRIFSGQGLGLIEEADGRAVGQVCSHKGAVRVRLGFDLFKEIAHLLGVGQPPSFAAVPTLERYIALLRSLIVGSGLPLAEIPPIPLGYKFLTCLTHDVDHPSIRLHRWDRTILGFCYRAVFGTFFKFVRLQIPKAALAANWIAVLKLPLVHFGLARDFWNTFERYTCMERGFGVTYFFIPRKRDPGREVNGAVIVERAAAYDVADMSDALEHLRSCGCEIGVHGIDAWCDTARGIEERTRVSLAAGVTPVGVRMHWLCFSSNSPAAIEDAGFSYDSSFGYNEVVGFRAGTSQVFKPLGTERLLELPLIIMDTALFFPSQMNLSFVAARKVVSKVAEEIIQNGGALTINWHDRSIAPERLWGRFYVWLIRRLKQQGGWFPTAASAVNWFRKRRSASFDDVRWDDRSLQVKVHVREVDTNSPGLIVRVHYPSRQRIDSQWSWSSSAGHVDVGVEDFSNITLEMPQPSPGLRNNLVQAKA